MSLNNKHVTEKVSFLFNYNSHVSVAELSTAKITKKLQQLPPSCCVATLHNALICFALLRSSVNEPLHDFPRTGFTMWHFCKVGNADF